MKAKSVKYLIITIYNFKNKVIYRLNEILYDLKIAR
jgi:hypothetical protein